MAHQDGLIQYLQGSASAGATANGNGTVLEGYGYTGAVQIEVNETAGGTCTLALQGSFDGGANWYAVGYQQVDSITVPARSVANVSVVASSKHVYQILDPYPVYRAVISAVAGGCTLFVRAYLVPA